MRYHGVRHPLPWLRIAPDMPAVIELPDIPAAERTVLVEELVRLIETLAEQTQQQAETIQQLRDEIGVLKGEKATLSRCQQIEIHIEI